MSEEQEYKVYLIKRALSERIMIGPHEIDESSLVEAGCLNGVCVLSANYNERVSYLGDLLVQMVNRNPKDDVLRRTVGQLCRALSYTLNSTSWREDRMYDFDLDEIKRKLRVYDIGS